MQQRLSFIGTYLTQADLVSFRGGRTEIRYFDTVRTRDVWMFDKEKPLRELALTSTVDSKSLRPLKHTRVGPMWQGW